MRDARCKTRAGWRDVQTMILKMRDARCKMRAGWRDVQTMIFKMRDARCKMRAGWRDVQTMILKMRDARCEMQDASWLARRSHKPLHATALQGFGKGRPFQLRATGIAMRLSQHSCVSYLGSWFSVLGSRFLLLDSCFFFCLYSCRVMFFCVILRQTII